MTSKITNKIKKQNIIKCKKCGDEIFSDTRKKMIDCKCKAISVDGCEHYVRVNGKAQDYEIIEYNSKNS